MAKYDPDEFFSAERVPDKNVVKSNADRIRAMSDEELAYRLAINECGYCHLREKCLARGPNTDCEDMWLDWLKSKAEVE